jgi:hypothetical protein
MKYDLIAIVALAAVAGAVCSAQAPAAGQPGVQTVSKKGRKSMKYLLMMNMKTDPESMSKGIMTWPQADIQAHIGFMMAFNQQLKTSGELVSAEGLAWPDQAKIVRAAKNGEPVTDGVFPESKEFLIGFWIVQVDSTERAYQIAAKASAAPGPGGAPLNMPIEVRQIMAGPPE